jgi:hypothetical protein
MITILCAARSSVYRSFPGLDVYTRARDAWNAKPAGPVIAHPPCRCWSKARCMVNLTIADWITEMQLGLFCAQLVIRNGGILEQPAFSALWRAADLPTPINGQTAGRCFSIAVDQVNFGHLTTKPTWLLFAGIQPRDIQWPGFNLANPRRARQMDCTPGQRSSTPLPFAKFLLAAAATATRSRRS